MLNKYERTMIKIHLYCVMKVNIFSIRLSVKTYQSECYFLNHIGVVHSSPLIFEYPFDVQDWLLLFIGYKIVISTISIKCNNEISCPVRIQ